MTGILNHIPLTVDMSLDNILKEFTTLLRLPVREAVENFQRGVC
jgi:hypothetical protein